MAFYGRCRNSARSSKTTECRPIEKRRKVLLSLDLRPFCWSMDCSGSCKLTCASFLQADFLRRCFQYSSHQRWSASGNARFLDKPKSSIISPYLAGTELPRLYTRAMVSCKTTRIHQAAAFLLATVENL